jgi:hypothetical protein
MECSDDNGHIFGKNILLIYFRSWILFCYPIYWATGLTALKLQAVRTRSQTADNSLSITSFIPVLVTVLLLGLLARGTHLIATLYSCVSFCLSRSLAIQAISALKKPNCG